MDAPENSTQKNDLQHYLNALNETLADSQLFMRLIKEYLDEENDQTKKVLLAEMLLSKERAQLVPKNLRDNERSENSTGPDR
jgi:hypothetical protein